MTSIKLTLGDYALPGQLHFDDLLEGKKLDKSEILEQQSLGLARQVALLPDDNLKAIGAGRIVRKTSEKQARWVISSAYSTWQKSNINCDLNKVGLFLGVGTVDCEDNDEPISTQPDPQSYIKEALSLTKPLAGLTVLNSTAASHIANLLNITGPNSVFSPHADAGAQAIIEAFYNVKEGHCEHALVATASQKVTPWYFLAYRSFFEKYQAYKPNPTECAAAAIISINKEIDKQKDSACAGQMQLLALKRMFMPNEANLPCFDNLLTELAGQGYDLPKQIIYSGRYGLSSEMQQSLVNYFPQAMVCNLEQLLGYTGPSSALCCLNLVSSLFSKHKGIDTESSQHVIKDRDISTALVICHGDNGQICYLVVGALSHDE